ncbi:Sugar phosphate permease [Saccharopolyspora antimicrobica]|uniref:Sugar phosphate permease n=1 Tax=Saccharopolyspora antimicrobica TaxID=455193 RepID=A0A1I5KAJ7_9PSEU|nr:MFS transporter [Saccharopolyspora antimicrobica]RKT81924.1 sugar phosphate permease [Saccharopolyspora antimicrobica]SFO82008.1 Sugar phosphate permease [Saccharopolyspora antimicrobica]
MTIAQTATATKRRFGVLAADFAVLGLNYADRAAFGIAGPLIIAEFGFSNAAFGWLASIFALAYSPFGFIGGWLADRFGPRNVMGWAVVAWSAFTALTAAGVGFVSLLIIRFLFGAGEGPQATVTAKLMHNWFPKRELGTALGIANAATPLGGAVATPVVVGIMHATQGNWRLPFLIFGALGVLAAIGWFWVVRDTPEQHPKVNEAEVRVIRQDQDEVAAAEQEDAPGFWSCVAKPAVWATAIAYFGYAWILWTFVSWFPNYLVQERGIDLDGLAIAGAIPWVGGCVGLIAGGALTDWLVRRMGDPEAPRRWLVIICLAATAVLFALVSMVTTTFAAVAVMTVVVFLLYLTGAQYWIIVGEAVPASRYGAVSGAVQMFATSASIFAPLVTGYLADSSLGWGGVFVVAGSITIIGPVLLLFAGRRRRA